MLLHARHAGHAWVPENRSGVEGVAHYTRVPLSRHGTYKTVKARLCGLGFLGVRRPTNPQPQTPNPKPKSLNPKPKSLNPKNSNSTTQNAMPNTNCRASDLTRACDLFNPNPNPKTPPAAELASGAIGRRPPPFRLDNAGWKAVQETQARLPPRTLQ